MSIHAREQSAPLKGEVCPLKDPKSSSSVILLTCHPTPCPLFVFISLSFCLADKSDPLSRNVPTTQMCLNPGALLGGSM